MISFFRPFFLSVAAFVFCLPQAVNAVAIGPTTFDFSAGPGQMVEAVLTVRNDESLPRSFLFQIQKFIPKGEYGQQEFLPLSDTSGLPSWIYLSMPAVTLNPGQSLDVPFRIIVPQQAAPGSYYAALFVSGQDEGAGKDTGAGLTARVGALVFFTVQGNLVERLSLVDFQRTDDGVLSHLPAAFSLTLRNEGNTHLTPEGILQIRNVIGMRAHSVDINGARAKVLPGSSRRLVMEWSKAAPREGRGFFHEMREEWSNFGFGLYRVELSLTMRGVSGEAPVLYFWVLPWRLGLVVLTTMFVLVLAGTAGRKWWVLRKL